MGAYIIGGATALAIGSWALVLIAYFLAADVDLEDA